MPESHWNYRVLKRPHLLKSGELIYTYAIHEVHYKNDIPVMWTSEPATIVGDEMDDVKLSYRTMSRAMKYPILEIYSKDGEQGIREIEDGDE